jgi:apolipoprotein N-acyltransferase
VGGYVRFGLGAGLALISGVLAALSAPPFGGSFLIFAAFVPMIVAQHRVLPGRWSALAPGIGYGVWFASQLSPGLREARVAAPFQLLPLYAGALVAALSLGTKRFHEETGYRWFAVATPLAWVALDFLRGSELAVLGGTWGNPAYALWSHPWFLQPVNVFGIYGLELLLLAVNWGIAGAVMAWMDRRGTGAAAVFPARRARKAAAWLGAAVAGWTALSLALLGEAQPVWKVAAIQPGQARAEEELRRDVEQTREAARAEARLIVWREGGLNFDPRRERTGEVAALAREAGAWLVAGFGARAADGRRLNMAAVFSPRGELAGAYGKDHPGTFAGDFSDEQGGYPVWETERGKFAVIICYDLDFTDTARRMARQGAGMLAVPSNDSVPSLAETHYPHLVFRAIENRVSLIKADRMRGAAAVDPWGRVVAKVVDRRGRRSTLLAELPAGRHDGPAVRLGDWTGWAAVAAVAAFALRRARRAMATAPRRDGGKRPVCHRF